MGFNGKKPHPLATELLKRSLPFANKPIAVSYCRSKWSKSHAVCIYSYPTLSGE